ncbi:hypothetical protein CTAYLR_008737 [Chrysophaeum taylorii]|uniref:VWFA domain-containing protein n=1 Tax=Chrysophaeum taylorii TaxID=2483200 RepID=A0AAD7XQ77_9STRA|nr:hypothetical protein CTAYLR_008737 [Chrysophaeum taylorii]
MVRRWLSRTSRDVVVNTVSIGGVEVALRGASVSSPWRATGYLETLPESLAACLRWVAQRDALGQDAVLICSPGERRRARHVAFAFAELVNSEAFYVGISGDTTESDLRQRRELSAGGSSWSDAPPVRAAVRGGVLVLDGLERAERNVLPTLNNLLENREMTLDDGRLLMPEAKVVGETPLVEAVPASFRVVAIASPSPPYRGRPLDPPLRSRLQSHLVPGADAYELAGAASAISGAERAGVVAGAQQLVRLEIEALKNRKMTTRRDFFFSVSTAAVERALTRATEDDTARALLRKVYPPLAQPNRSRSLDRVDAGLPSSEETRISEPLLIREDHHDVLYLSARQRRVFEAAKRDLVVPGGGGGGRVLLLGTRGGGKSVISRALLGPGARRLACHEDMSSRDLLQRREVDESGASAWRDSPFVAAAREGVPAVLDGIHRLNDGVLVAALGRALEDGVIDLPDGSRLACDVPVVALARSAEKTRPPSFLAPDVAALFCTYELPDWTSEPEIAAALEAVAPALSPASRDRLAAVVAASRADDSPEDARLSTRAARRVARFLERDPSASLRKLVRDALMAKFLPQNISDAIDSWFSFGEKEEDERPSSSSSSSRWRASREGEAVVARLGDEEVARLGVRAPGAAPELVPRLGTAYVASPAAEAGVARLATSLSSGERHVAIVGNQGVGKNVVVDRLLELMNAEREYSQLHRDTTLSSLTTTPTVDEGGKLRYVDAPLARAAIRGRVAVLDEADKAPVDVVAALRGLVADGELALADGRVLRRFPSSPRRPEDVAIHEDFRLVVLANRPGYPFHGNSFFRASGDAFETFAVDNPDVDSEAAILATVAPGLDPGARRRLVSAFAELRARFESGSLDYPYSMRECVHVARHLDKYPEDGASAALANVLAHDAYSPRLALVLEVFEAHGFENSSGERAFVPGGEEEKRRKALAVEYSFKEGPRGSGGASVPRTALGAPKFGEVDPGRAPHVGGNSWAGGSGGSDTAGLGGRGGPFRLWDGQNVPHQVSEEAKAEVSEAARRAAREHAEIARRERLAEIDQMTETDWAVYSDMLDRIAPHVASMHAALDAARDKRASRRWLKRRADGELDDEKIVDGIAGEKLVFKKRGRTPDINKRDDDDDDFSNRRRHKRSLLFLMDCSGSMYRFHPVDGRLGRMLEATMLVMEALDGLDNYEYAIRGHSGSSHRVDLVDFGRPPPNRGERLKVLQRVVAHASFCEAGDTTIDATETAVKDVLDRRRATQNDEDENSRNNNKALVVALSDANFRRYGLDPADWARALLADDVEGYAIMIGSIGEEADRVSAALPPGRGHVAMDVDDLPVVFDRILRHAGIIQDDEDINSRA